MFKNPRQRALLAGVVLAAGLLAPAAAVPLATAAPGDPPDLTLCPWMDTSKSADERAQLVLDASTLGQTMRWLDEQAANLPEQTVWPPSWSGSGATYEAALPCTPTVYYTDGPEGVRHDGATTFPAQIGLAATWNEALAYSKGLAQGAESYDLGYNGVLAPGVASGRTPLSGRTPEYLGEDSLLSGLMAGQLLLGLQENPVITSLKHYVANEQEFQRSDSSSNVSERALHEVYSLPFEIAIKAGDPSSVMCSYNQINGTYACENSILNDILKTEIGYEGFIMSDFGAVHSTTPSLVNGLDLELNAPNYFSPASLNAALTAGEITEAQIEAAAYRVVRAYIKAGLFDHPLPDPVATNASTPANKAVARTIAEQGSVLLKNDQVLPLTSQAHSVAIIGSIAASPTEYTGSLLNASSLCSQGGMMGSAGTMPCTDLVSPLSSITQRVQSAGGTVVFNDGSDPTAAATVAAAADIAIVFGYIQMGEGSDITSLNLMANGDELVAAVAAAAAQTVVVLETGSAVVMPWLDAVDAVLEIWYPGEQVGPALTALLWGDTNPSGKLPMTFPTSLAATPIQTTAQYPGLDADGAVCTAGSGWFGGGTFCQVDFSEDLAVGYKWYEETGTAPLFAFGHGLSYTDFEYSNLEVVSSDVTQAGATITIAFDVSNTGGVAGTEIPQVYLTLPDSSDTPGKRLVGFDRITLAAGQTTRVTVTVASTSSDHPLSVWDVDADEWVLVEGDYAVAVGAASDDIRLTAAVTLDSTLPPSASAASLTALQALVTEAEALTEADYTAASWAELDGALASAQTILAGQRPTQADVDAATTALSEALAGLETAPTGNPTDDPTDEPTGDPSKSPDDSNGASLPTAGSGAPWWAGLAAAFSLIGGGALLVRSSRRSTGLQVV